MVTAPPKRPRGTVGERRRDSMDATDGQRGMTVSRLLRRLRFSFPLIVVTVDGALVSRDNYATWQISDSPRSK